MKWWLSSHQIDASFLLLKCVLIRLVVHYMDGHSVPIRLTQTPTTYWGGAVP